MNIKEFLINQAKRAGVADDPEFQLMISASVLILVSVLGLSPDMDSILKLCEKYDVILLEDNCESQGTSYKGKKLGNFGLMSSFSTFFGHTMSTIEGGVITTNV